MGAYLGVIIARIGLFGASRSEVRWGNMKKSVECLVFGILLALMLVIGGIETNPGSEMEENMERLMDNMMAQCEEGKRI
jgi:hypothetical protein